MNKYVRGGAALLVVQGILVGGYLLIRDQRTPAGDAPEVIATALPNLVVRYPDGSSGSLADRAGRPMLIHFWATWCPPCRDELPHLIALANKSTAPILLIALDDDWEPVRRFLDAPIPPFMALANGSQVERDFGVHELPESFLVDRTGTMTLHFRSAQDWTAPTTLELLPNEMR